MEEIDHSSSPMNPDIIGEEVVHHTGELLQHREVVKYNTLVSPVDRVSYNDLSNITGQLITTVVNSRQLASSVMNHCTEWVKKLRLKQKFKPTFIDFPCQDSQINNTIGNEEILHMPKPAVAVLAPPSNCKKRKKSYRENYTLNKYTRALFF